METVRLAFKAMATRFEFMLLGDDPVHLRAAAEEAMREVQRVERNCNFYAKSSELSRINREAAQSPVRLSGLMLRLLSASEDLFHETSGLFDPSVAPALASWGLRHQTDSGRIPRPDQLQTLIKQIGLDGLSLDRSNRTIRFNKPGLQLDLGGIAKGWALDEARMVLEESGIERALLHGGTSTAVTIGSDAEDVPWKIGVEDPYLTARSKDEDASEERAWIATIPLRGGAMSVSGVQGKSFIRDDGTETIEYGHIIHPRTGRAVSGPRLSLVVGESATACDAWSTALLAAPEQDPPVRIQGTAFLKTDSGWIQTAGRVPETWLDRPASAPSP